MFFNLSIFFIVWFGSIYRRSFSKGFCWDSASGADSTASAQVRSGSPRPYLCALYLGVKAQGRGRLTGVGWFSECWLFVGVPRKKSLVER